MRQPISILLPSPFPSPKGPMSVSVSSLTLAKSSMVVHISRPRIKILQLLFCSDNCMPMLEHIQCRIVFVTTCLVLIFVSL